MEITGIICEYNPFHLGHKKQLDMIRRQKGPNSGIVCLMSGNFVQRGSPAIIDKIRRAKAAILGGADLVLELPVTCALSSAEGFAAGGVRILSGFCDDLCFGAETADGKALLDTAATLLSPAFSEALRTHLDRGLSFPAARQAALEAMGFCGGLLETPNNILAVEYCKAILSQGSTMKPMPIPRCGNYHDTQADRENPSATSVRQLMVHGGDWENYIPPDAIDCFRDATLHTVSAGERAILCRLRTMSEEDFSQLPFGSEGLWRKLMHASGQETSLEEILTAVKSKRYTRTRLDRMVICAFLGITQKDLATPAPYVRVLAFNPKGREILKRAREQGSFPNIGQKMDHSYQQLESRCGSLYGLFAVDRPESPGAENAYRVYAKD